MPARHRRGFTLVEVLVVIGIAALLLAVAIPKLAPAVATERARATDEGLADAMSYARQYALNTSDLVMFTPNGCGYSVTRSSGAQLLSASATAPQNVSCTPLPTAVAFLGDGSAEPCTGSGATLACTSPPPNWTASSKVTASGTTWQLSLNSGGLVTSTVQ